VVWSFSQPFLFWTVLEFLLGDDLVFSLDSCTLHVSCGALLFVVLLRSGLQWNGQVCRMFVEISAVVWACVMGGWTNALRLFPNCWPVWLVSVGTLA
jgi:hypothetical protein